MKTSPRLAEALFVIAVMAFAGCSPRIVRDGYQISGNSAGEDCEVIIKKLADISEEDAEIVGRIRVKDTGFSTRCEESDVLNILRREACAVGADIVHIIEERRADMLSTCYRVEAELLRAKDGGAAANIQSDEEYGGEQVGNRVSSDQDRKRMMLMVPIISGLVSALFVLMLMGVQ